MPIIAKEKRNQLMRDGFCIFENVLAPEMVAELNTMSEWMIAQQDEEHFEQHRSQGCIIPYWTCPHPTFAELLVDPSAMAVLAELGFDSPKFWSGFVISKPPHSPPLYWHQDGVLWEHPISYTNQPQQYFLMYYLVDTNIHNGCLRLIPGSHLKRHALHDMRARDDDSVIRATDMDHLAFQGVEVRSMYQYALAMSLSAIRVCCIPPVPIRPISDEQCSRSGIGPPMTICPPKSRR